MSTTSSRELPATEALIVSLDEYIRARYGLLAVQTFEEERFVRFMRGVAPARLCVNAIDRPLAMRPPQG